MPEELSEEFMETLEILHRLGDDDLTRYVFALESLDDDIVVLFAHLAESYELLRGGLFDPYHGFLRVFG